MKIISSEIKSMDILRIAHDCTYFGTTFGLPRCGQVQVILKARPKMDRWKNDNIRTPPPDQFYLGRLSLDLLDLSSSRFVPSLVWRCV